MLKTEKGSLVDMGYGQEVPGDAVQESGVKSSPVCSSQSYHENESQVLLGNIQIISQFSLSKVRHAQMRDDHIQLTVEQGEHPD